MATFVCDERVHGHAESLTEASGVFFFWLWFSDLTDTEEAWF